MPLGAGKGAGVPDAGRRSLEAVEPEGTFIIAFVIPPGEIPVTVAEGEAVGIEGAFDAAVGERDRLAVGDGAEQHGQVIAARNGDRCRRAALCLS